MPTTCRSPAAPSRCSAPIRWRLRFPAGEEPPLVLDIATSIVSYGTIKNHKLLNHPLQADWMIDPKTGAAVTDPHKSAEALLLPMAGYKGAGLALMLGLLAGTLNGALFGRDCVDFNADPGTVTNTGQFVLALDPSRFQKPSKRSRPRSTATSAACEIPRRCRATMRCGCRAMRAPSAATTARATAWRCRRELLVQLDKLAAELSIKPLAAR